MVMDLSDAELHLVWFVLGVLAGMALGLHACIVLDKGQHKPVIAIGAALIVIFAAIMIKIT